MFADRKSLPLPDPSPEPKSWVKGPTLSPSEKRIKMRTLIFYILVGLLRFFRSISFKLNQIFVSDLQFIKLAYRRAYGKYPDLKTPKTFSEHLISLNIKEKLYFNELHNNEKTRCTDKLLVRGYVYGKGLADILVDLHFQGSNPLKIDFDKLPDQFIIKSNHGSGWNHIVRDKSTIDKNKIISQCVNWLSQNYYHVHRERQYNKIKPKILIEKLLLTDKNDVPNDIKCFCFNGKVRFFQTISQRLNGLNEAFYDRDWNRHIVTSIINGAPRTGGAMTRPRNLSEIIKIAETLSEKFRFVRVDLYAFDNRIYFGELTFTPDALLLRFSPSSFDYVCPSLWSI